MREDVKSIFAVLPERDAKTAHQRVSAQLETMKAAEPCELHWADVDMQGRFVRGGITDIFDYSTRLVSGVNEDVRLRNIEDAVRLDPPKAGAITFLPKGNEFLWYLPFLDSQEDEAPHQYLRALLVTYEIFDQTIKVFNQDAKLTHAERRVMFQLAAGIPLTAAATDDNVTFETKRSQTKAACSKLNCSGQKDLVSLALGQLVQLLSVSNTEANHVRIAEKFVAEHLRKDVRLTAQRLPNGRLLRVLEAGPADGTPILVFHGMIFPVLLKYAAEHLERNRIRLIMPMREAYLQRHSTRQLLKNEDFFQINLENAALYLESAGFSKISIIGQSAGALSAVKFADRFPEYVRKVILLSPNLGGEKRIRKSLAGSFFDGLEELSDKPGLFRVLSWEFKRFYADQKRVHSALTNIFGESKSDTEVLQGTSDRVPVHSWFVSYYQASLNGFADDMYASRLNGQTLIQGAKKPIAFVHGNDDRTVSFDFIDTCSLPERGDKLFGIKEAGHFSYASHPDAVWAHVREILDA